MHPEECTTKLCDYKTSKSIPRFICSACEKRIREEDERHCREAGKRWAEAKERRLLNALAEMK